MTIEEKNQYQAQIFSSRLVKNYNRLKKWARKNRIYCYRLYDRDIPEVPLAVELYTLLPEEIQNKMDLAQYTREAKGENESRYILLTLYERPYEKDEGEEKIWLELMAKKAAEVISIPQNQVIFKTRKKLEGNTDGKSGRKEQYEKNESEKQITGLTGEQGQLFKVNLTDYLDTGLFLDHRNLRAEIREKAKGKSLLNLFCYTGSFSVYGAEGKAKLVESVDLSNTYLSWAKENMELNGFSDEGKYHFIRSDVMEFLERPLPQTYDIIILDPPTFSNSKKTENTLDINRDWPLLVKKCLNHLSENGALYFSTNSRRLKFDPELLPKTKNGSPLYTVQDITARTIGEDFRNQKIHRVWKIFPEETY